MDRDAMTRAQRRRQAVDALEFELDRERILEGQLEDVVAELEGPRVDEEVFSRMAPDEVRAVREAMHLDGGVELEHDDWLELEDELSEADLAETESATEEEIARLREEIAASRLRAKALERYIEALDGGSDRGDGQARGDEAAAEPVSPS